MSDETKNELKLIVIALSIALDVYMKAWWLAAFVFSYAVLRLIWLSAWRDEYE